ncbi:acyl-CoA thioester hydrolase/BAAT C-terminal domain-containing protein [Arsenicicoccus piscis]|uniref:Acyl-CoA thioesterase n=1 Tax=Arsenicicoccus piscis TaxID=673954 RepID=A0ABQ6HRG0_9MICO|nr:acyl-CoA thioester hydrolase/BAAT C-terminal domain-containing protein [Arsenicicoccus piscis]GMA21043.1 acyl-CoA thioesterase [Arsenicicoccus piscis]
MTTPEQRLHLRLRPATRSGTGVLLVAGSSGRIDEGRARLLAAHGADVLVLRWFGAPGLQPGPFEVPLELFVEALDDLAVDNERLAVVGLSFGAEAALLLASKDARVETVVAFAPSAYVWAGVPDSAPGQTSHWTWAGLPVPFVPFVEEWEPTEDPPAYTPFYEACLAAADAQTLAAATIPVDGLAELVLVAGGDDQVWPATTFARDITGRRAAAGLPTRLVEHPAAGHRAILPGEAPVAAGRAMARGGTETADRELGARAWPHLVRVLRLHG